MSSPMSMSVYVILASFLVSTALCRPDDSAAEVSCTFNETNYAVGAMWAEEGVCRGWICQDDGTIASRGCRVYKLREGCVMVEGDATKDYPECCDQPSCPGMTQVSTTESGATSLY